MSTESDQSQLLAGWKRFWHTPEPTSTLALVRIALGLLTVAWLATLAPNLSAFFGTGGILAVSRAAGSGQVLLHQWADTTTFDTYWVQATEPAPTAGSPITVNDTAPTSDQWNLAAIEVYAAG